MDDWKLKARTVVKLDKKLDRFVRPIEISGGLSPISWLLHFRLKKHSNLFTDVKSAVASKINDVRRLLMSKYAILINNTPHYATFPPQTSQYPMIHCMRISKTRIWI